MLNIDVNWKIKNKSVKRIAQFASPLEFEFERKLIILHILQILQ